MNCGSSAHETGKSAWQLSLLACSPVVLVVLAELASGDTIGRVVVTTLTDVIASAILAALLTLWTVYVVAIWPITNYRQPARYLIITRQ